MIYFQRIGISIVGKTILNGDDLYICIATVGNTIQTINSPMYDTYMSTPGNTAKLGTTHSNIQTAQRSVPGWKRTYNALVSILPSQHSTHYASQAYLQLPFLFYFYSDCIPQRVLIMHSIIFCLLYLLKILERIKFNFTK